MQAIGAAVDNIHSLEENLAPLLIDLGRVHGESVMFDARYFKLFKVSFSETRQRVRRNSEKSVVFLPRRQLMANYTAA